MKKCILLSALFLLLQFSHAQYSLSFCENVTAEGSPQKISTSFTAETNGMDVKLLVSAEGGFDTDQLKFTIYFINAEGNEEEISELLQKTEPRWNYVWKEVVLYNPGTYRVKVYNAKGTYLTSANMNIKRSAK